MIVHFACILWESIELKLHNNNQLYAPMFHFYTPWRFEEAMEYTPWRFDGLTKN